MIKRFNANKARLKRHRRMRNHLEGSLQRPRLSVYRSGLHIYAQIIDDTTGQTLAAASSRDEVLRDFTPPQKAVEPKEVKAEPAPVEVAAEAAPARGKGAKTEKGAEKGVKRTPVEALEGIASNRKVAIAHEVGKLVAQRAREKGIGRVVFDRGGYAYHGRVAALAEGAREVGLSF